MENKFIRADDVARELSVSKPYAYKLIRKLNEEVKDKGFITIAGRIIVFLEMQDKLREFSELQMHEKPESTLQLTKLKVRVDQIEKEIDVLVEKIVTANKATMAYINKKIEELDEERTRLKKLPICRLTYTARKMLEQLRTIWITGMSLISQIKSQSSMR